MEDTIIVNHHIFYNCLLENNPDRYFGTPNVIINNLKLYLPFGNDSDELFNYKEFYNIRNRNLFYDDCQVVDKELTDSGIVIYLRNCQRINNDNKQ